jgi:uncharacterized protein YhaN
MRLDRLDLTRYGRFTEQSLTFAPPPKGGPDLHIVFGRNEAGKSTLFSGWLDLLFGIPTRSRYDFLHPGPTLQIGARLTHAGGVLDVKRLKRNSASLLDQHDAPVPEALLQGALAGLTRDGYGAMFSLDDETLEKGGEGILDSKGDLGEMLFAASAGLASLSPGLEKIRAELDGFHRSGKRSGWLYDTKKHLLDLDQQRRQTEVSPAALQKLARAAEIAEQSWRTARAQQDQAQIELEHLQGLAATLPLAARLASAEAQLAPLAHLPVPSPQARQEFERITGAQLALNTRLADRALRLQGLAEDSAALRPDDAILAETGAIEQAEGLRAEHDSALKDLPRREAEAGDLRREIAAIVADLGPSMAAVPPLPAPQLARLRALLARRSGLLAAAQASESEARKAGDLLLREAARLGDLTPGDDDDAPLAALLARLGVQDLGDQRRRALQECDMLQGRLAEAMAALSPWSGEVSLLAALKPPAAAEIDAWQQAADLAHQTLSDAHRELASLGEELARQQDALAARNAGQDGAGMTLADAAAARSRREALWATHLGALNPSTAVAFEQALREDDRISAVLAEALAESRRVAQQQAGIVALQARIAATRNRESAAQDQMALIGAKLGDVCTAMGLPLLGLSDLKRWLDLRLVALAEARALHNADLALGRQAAAIAGAEQSLRVGLGLEAGDQRGLDLLVAIAQARLAATESRREARRQLTSLASDKREREAAAASAALALEIWQQDWTLACSGHPLVHLPPEIEVLGARLDLLDRLGTQSRVLDGLEDRIAKMQDNRNRFDEARRGVLARLGDPADMAWPDVLARLRQAQDKARDRESLARQITVETQQDLQDKRMRALRDEECAQLGAALGWDRSSGTALADHLSLCTQAAVLRQDIAALRAEMQNLPAPAAMDDPETVRQRIDGLKSDLTLYRDAAEALHGDYLNARNRLENVGGDDALARLAAERENLLLETREKAMAHLAARFGLMAFEAGLRRYRDQHRSTMLARASQAFSRMTNGAYQGLATQPDGKSEILIALSQAEGSKVANVLSKGTRMQLYLALRVAGYHELAQSRPSVPFIADDIMESFDDQRASSAFALLAEMSHVGQVIYLTHHRHLLGIAQKVCPEAQIIEI